MMDINILENIIKEILCFSRKNLRLVNLVNCNFEIRAPSGQRNYGGFDYAFTLKTKGIDGNIKINKRVFEVQHSKSFIMRIVIKLWI